MVDKKNLENRLNDIVGLKLTEFYFQPTEEVLGGNVIVLNFGDKNRFSLHIQCFLRATFNGKIILTSSDEFFLQNYQRCHWKNMMNKMLMIEVYCQKHQRNL